MSASGRLDPGDLYSTASGTARRFGLGGVVRNVFALIITAIGFVMTRGIDALSSTFIKPLFALGDAGEWFVKALFVSPPRALSQTWDYAVYSLTQGNWAFFGPLTPLIMMGIVLASVAMYLYWADRFNVDLPTTGDIPGLSLDESGADDEQ